MAMLMSIWLGVSTLSALLLIPSILHVFQPEFVFGRRSTPAAPAGSAALAAHG